MTALDSAVFEKSEDVLWTEGAGHYLLHHGDSGAILQLTPDERVVWEYCDGLHDLSSIAEETHGQLQPDEIARFVERLAGAGFLRRVR